jgi:adenylate kinase family enzyme
MSNASTDDRVTGAGKGTQDALIAAHFDIPHIAAGEGWAATARSGGAENGTGDRCAGCGDEVA